MSDKTAIEWAANADGSPGATWNPIRARNHETGKLGWFCVHESDGCRFCYAERINVERFGNGVAFKAQNQSQVEIFLDEKTLTQPLRWKKPRTIFVCSMSDLFGAFVPDAFIDKVFAIAALCPQHTFIVLTKRARRMREYFAKLADDQAPDERHAPPRRFDGLACELTGSPCAAGLIEELWWPLPNVWLGVSAEDQPNANARIPELLAAPAAVRFVSLEPLLGPIVIARWLRPRCMPHGDGYGGREGPGFTTDFTTIDWAIVGGESGPSARPMHPEWARCLRDQCAAAGTAYFFKQWGEWAPGHRAAAGSPEEMFKIGKKTAGRVLDGYEHNARPPLAHEARTIGAAA